MLPVIVQRFLVSTGKALDNIDNFSSLHLSFLILMLFEVLSTPMSFGINDGVEKKLPVCFMMKDIQNAGVKSEIQKKVHTDIDANTQRD